MTLAALGGCTSDQRYSYWVLNDSDQEIVIDVREQLHATYRVPAHAYAGLFAGMGAPGADWTIRLVDDECAQLQSVHVDAAHNLVYVDPTLAVELVSAAPWSHGLRSAHSATPSELTTPCP